MWETPGYFGVFSCPMPALRSVQFKHKRHFPEEKKIEDNPERSVITGKPRVISFLHVQYVEFMKILLLIPIRNLSETDWPDPRPIKDISKTHLGYLIGNPSETLTCFIGDPSDTDMPKYMIPIYIKKQKVYKKKNI